MWIALEHVESDSQLYGGRYVIAWMISGLPVDSNKKMPAIKSCWPYSAQNCR